MRIYVLNTLGNRKRHSPPCNYFGLANFTKGNLEGDQCLHLVASGSGIGSTGVEKEAELQ